MKKKATVFIETNTGSFATSEAQTAPVIPSSIQLLNSCKTCSLSKFIECYCNGNLSVLDLSGFATQEQLQEAWNEILFEYSTLIKGENSRHLFELQKQIALLQAHIIYTDYAVRFLRLRYNEQVIQILAGEGYNVEGEYNTEPYYASLDHISSLCITKTFDYDELKAEYTRLQNTQSGKKQTDEDFEMTLVSLSRFQHYNIEPETTTVFRFAQIYNSYVAEINVMAKKRIDG